MAIEMQQSNANPWRAAPIASPSQGQGQGGTDRSAARSPIVAATVCAALAVAGALSGAPAAAQNAVNAPRSSASANVFGPFVGGGQTSQVEIAIRNGVVTSSSDPSGIGSRVATASPDGFTNTASVASVIGNSALARADLRTGTVKAVVGIGTAPVQRGFAEARIADTVFFDNNSGGTVALPFAFRFDGSISDPSNFGSSATAALQITGATTGCLDGSYTSCATSSLRLLGGGFFNQTTVIGYAGNGIFNGVQQGGAFFFNAPDNVDLTNYSVFKNWGNPAGFYDTIVSSTLLLPTGISRFGIDLRLALDCSNATTVCDFGQSGAFDFGDLPTGLSFTSASGAFLAGEPGVGGVPEPASWALLIAGFGVVGTRLRLRRPRTVAA